MRRSSIIIYQEPVAKGRPRFTRGGIAFTPKTTRDAEKVVKIEMNTAFKEEPFDTPIKVIMRFGMTRPKSVKQDKRPLPSVKPDLDNIAKLYCDSGNDILWADDALICSLHLEKKYCEEGFIEIIIEELIE